MCNNKLGVLFEEELLVAHNEEGYRDCALCMLQKAYYSKTAVSIQLYPDVFNTTITPLPPTHATDPL
jgi:hypothetical protein